VDELMNDDLGSEGCWLAKQVDVRRSIPHERSSLPISRHVTDVNPSRHDTNLPSPARDLRLEDLDRDDLLERPRIRRTKGLPFNTNSGHCPT
jgi:hypothetical protein